MASLDTRRPAAMEQLATLGQAGRRRHPADRGGPDGADIARRAMNAGRLGGYDVVILDTAGRITLDEAMMNEAAEIARFVSRRDPAGGRQPDGPGRGADGARLSRAACRSRALC
jgi:signal recognition particle subunit SRP54